MRAITTGWKFLEGLRWRDGRFWAVDAFAGKVIAVAEGGATETILALDGAISSMGWLPDGRMVVVSMDQRRLLVSAGDGLVELADLSRIQRGIPNDMIVDAHGRCFIGTMGFDIQGGAPMAPGVLVRVDPDGSVHVVAEDLTFPNGIALLDGGTTLVVAETFAQRLTSFRVATDGALTDRRAWASFGPLPETSDLAKFVPTMILGPDGICADAHGNIWVSDPFGRQVVLVAPGGAILKRLRLGESLGAYACAVGGEDAGELGICVARSHDRARIEMEPQNSDLLMVDIESIPPAAG